MVNRLTRMTVGGVPRVVDRAALPTVTIDTAGAAPIVDKVTYLTATMTITGGPAYSGTIQIRGRGNSTWERPKKPYRLKLATAASLIPGVAADRDWVLLADYVDPSALRTAIAMDIGQRCPSLAWTPRFRHVQVVLNGDWIGLYQLGEHVKIGANRVDITSMKAGDTSGRALTGGYSLEIDQRLEENSEVGFRTPLQNVPIVFDDPDGVVPAQFTYIQDHLTAFEATLYGTSWLDPVTGYARYIDTGSWVDWYLVNELCANQDSGFYSSCKLYKDRDPDGSTLGKLYMGPLWDFDLSLGRQAGLDTERSPTAWHTRTGATWIARMLTDPAFSSLLGTRWAALRTSLVTTAPISQVVDRHAGQVLYSTPRDRARWPASTARLDLNRPAAIKTWLSTRIAWLDTQWT